MTFVSYNIRVPVEIINIEKVLDFETVTNEWEYGQAVLGTFQVTMLKFGQPVYIERSQEFEKLGRFALVVSNTIFGYGTVEEINPKIEG